MHAFLDDHLLVFDAFGLTRVELSTGKVKHNKKVVGELGWTNGRLFVGHSEVANNRFAMAVPELVVVPIEDRWNYNLTYGTAIGVTPDGLPFEVTGRSLVIYELDGTQRRKVDVVPRALRAIDLGPALPVTPQPSAQVTTGPDGTVVVVGNGEIYGGKLVGDRVEQGWSADAASSQGQLRLRAGSFGAFVSAFHVAEQRAYCTLVVGGRLVRSETVACVGPVDFDGTRLVYQATPEEVHRKAFGDSALDRIGIPLRSRGAGVVMADGERLWFVPPDREQLRDLMNDEVVERGLPGNERDHRKKVLAFVESFRPAANAANLHLRLEALRPPAYGEGPRPSWQWNEGDQSLLRTAVIGNLLARSYDDRDLSAGSYSPPRHLAPVTVAHVDTLLAAVEQHGLDLLAGIAMLDNALEEHWSQRSSGARAPRFEKPAAEQLLRAVLRALGAEPPDRLTAEALIASLDPSSVKWSGGAHTDAQKAASFIVLDYFEAAALPVIVDWLIDRPSGRVRANMHIMGDVADAMIAAFPQTAEPYRAALSRRT